MPTEPKRNRAPEPLLRVFIAALLLLQGVALAEMPMDPGRLGWTRLEMKAVNPVGEVTVEVRLEKGAGNDGLRLPEAGGSPVIEPGERKILRLDMDIRASFLLKRKQWRGGAWVLQGNGAALQRVRLKAGRSGSYKRYRYAERGVYRLRSEPKGRRESRLPPERWSRARHAYYPLAPAAEGCEMVSDPLALLYLIPASGLLAGGERTFCIFNKHDVYRVTLVAAGLEPVRVGYPDPAAGADAGQGPRNIQGRRVRLTARPLDPGNRNLDPFEFIGLEGDVEFVFDPATGIPLLVRGVLPGAGESELRLVRAELAP
ncbi:MAG TPA: hypothetical protein ENK50_01940 [Sedimenticola sp.]|nr:hypothetical protein [Sedimenticola sp.]